MRIGSSKLAPTGLQARIEPVQSSNIAFLHCVSAVANFRLGAARLRFGRVDHPNIFRRNGL